MDTYSYAKPGNFSSGQQLVKDSNLLNPLNLVSPACLTDLAPSMLEWLNVNAASHAAMVVLPPF